MELGAHHCSISRQRSKEISRIKWDPHTTGGVIAMAAAQAADQLDASLMVAFTVSGDTARRMSRLRSETPLDKSY